MAEPVFIRVERILGSSAEDVAGRTERAAAGSLMRDAIRQVVRAIDEVQAEYRSARRRSKQASKLQDSIRARLSDLEEKARFALGRGREDLAEAALSAQPPLKERLAQLEQARADAEGLAGKLETCLAELQARKRKTEKTLGAQGMKVCDRATGTTAREGERIGKEAERSEAFVSGCGQARSERFSVGAMRSNPTGRPGKTDPERQARIAERRKAIGKRPAGCEQGLDKRA